MVSHNIKCSKNTYNRKINIISGQLSISTSLSNNKVQITFLKIINFYNFESDYREHYFSPNLIFPLQLLLILERFFLFIFWFRILYFWSKVELHDMESCQLPINNKNVRVLDCNIMIRLNCETGLIIKDLIWKKGNPDVKCYILWLTRNNKPTYAYTKS